MSAPDQKTGRGMPILVRGMGIFLLFAAFLTGLFWLCLHHYRDVAEWGTQEGDRQESLVYDGAVYFHAGTVGDPGIGSSNFAAGSALGEVKPEGRDALRRSYPVHAVKTNGGKVRDGYLIVILDDGESHVYYRQDLDNPRRPSATETLPGGGDTGA